MLPARTPPGKRSRESSRLQAWPLASTPDARDILSLLVSLGPTPS